jgi:hypothetical protein
MKAKTPFGAHVSLAPNYEIHETVGNHLLLLGVPFLALAVDVDPHAQPAA